MIVAQDQSNHPCGRGRLHVLSETADMAAVEEFDNTYRARLRLLHRQRHGLVADGLTEPPPTIDHSGGIGLAHHLDAFAGEHHALVHVLQILCHPNDAVRIVPHQVRQHQRMRDYGRFIRFQASAGEYLGAEFLQRRWSDAGHEADSPTKRTRRLWGHAVQSRLRAHRTGRGIRSSDLAKGRQQPYHNVSRKYGSSLASREGSNALAGKQD